jgi:hypothetical protein
MAGNKQQGIGRSLDFTSILRTLGLCAFISMLALPLKSYAQYNFTDPSDPQVVDQSQLALDAVENFAAYANGSLTVSGATTINGDLGLGPSGTPNFVTTPNVIGTYLNSGLGYVSNRMSDVSAYAAGLTATTNLASITGRTTITGNGGFNVIDLPSIALSSKNLNLIGTANDIFVFNVTNVSFLGSGGSGAAGITLSGVTPNHVLFNLLNPTAGANALIATPTSAMTIFGTFITPDASMDIGSGVTIDGGVFAGGNNLTLNGSTINAEVFMLPEPSSFALVGMACLFGLGLWSRRRTRR